jgi:hypothetical protein
VTDRLTGLVLKFPDPDTLTVTLASGRVLTYYRFKIRIKNADIYYDDNEGRGSVATVRGEDRMASFGRLQSGKYSDKVHIWGGKLTGHIIQSMARDVMRDALLRLDATGHSLLLSVHDEAVCVGMGDFDRFVETFSQRPEWLPEDFPLAADCYQAVQRYHK